VFSEKTVLGSMGGYGVFDESIQMMADGRFNGEPLITGKIVLDDIVSAGFEALIQHKEENVKILVAPTA
jgi:(R,R)-butanediol dehydrogenase/meso-butanediol dehydrogenase/diacetyl reductase